MASPVTEGVVNQPENYLTATLDKDFLDTLGSDPGYDLDDLIRDPRLGTPTSAPEEFSLEFPQAIPPSPVLGQAPERFRVNVSDV